MRIVESINLFSLITIPLSIWIITSGRISWEVVGLIWLMEIKLDLKFKKN